MKPLACFVLLFLFLSLLFSLIYWMGLRGHFRLSYENESQMRDHLISEIGEFLTSSITGASDSTCSVISAQTINCESHFEKANHIKVEVEPDAKFGPFTKDGEWAEEAKIVGFHVKFDRLIDRKTFFYGGVIVDLSSSQDADVRYYTDSEIVFDLNNYTQGLSEVFFKVINYKDDRVHRAFTMVGQGEHSCTSYLLSEVLFRPYTNFENSKFYQGKGSKRVISAIESIKKKSSMFNNDQTPFKNFVFYSLGIMTGVSVEEIKPYTSAAKSWVLLQSFLRYLLFLLLFYPLLKKVSL